MNLQTFILIFIGFIFLGSLAVTGWFFVTRGWTEKMPNGKEKRYGKIFKGWYFFWNKQKGTPRNVYYETHELYMLVGKIAEMFPALKFEARKGTHIAILEGDRKTHELILAQIEGKFDVVTFEVGEGEYQFAGQYPVYVFPEWLRFPLATCATCFSSIYGSIFYWGIVSMVKESFFGWASLPWLASIFFWISFCLTLAVINTALAKKYN